MSLVFAQPWWLLLLVAWPLLVLVARVRSQRREHAAPDFLLWKRAAAKLPPAASRARPSWRDLAWIAPLVLLTLGLAEPELRGDSARAEAAILVDSSASMETRGPDGSSRRDRGVAEARRLIGSSSVSAQTVDGDLAESALAIDSSGTPVVVVTDRAMPDLPPRIGLVQVVDDARNAGIVAAGFDPIAGLLVRVEADPGAGARILRVRDGAGRELLTESLADPTWVRKVLPPDLVLGAPPPIQIDLDPGDALALDDRVSLQARKAPLRLAIQDAAPPSIERALRACPGVEVVHGDDPAAARLFAAPVAGTDGFETGAPAPRQGGLSGPRPFEGLDGPAAWKAIFPLLKQPPGTQVLLSAGDAPLLVRHERTFVLLANPDEEGWASVPSFPLTIARLVEVASGGERTRLVADRAVLSSQATHVLREGPAAPPRAPISGRREASPRGLAAWCFVAAAIAIAAMSFRTAGFSRLDVAGSVANRVGPAKAGGPGL